MADGTIQAVDTSPFEVDICLHCQSNTIQNYFCKTVNSLMLSLLQTNVTVFIKP